MKSQAHYDAEIGRFVYRFRSTNPTWTPPVLPQHCSHDAVADGKCATCKATNIR